MGRHGGSTFNAMGGRSVTGCRLNFDQVFQAHAASHDHSDVQLMLRRPMCVCGGLCVANSETCRHVILCCGAVQQHSQRSLSTPPTRASKSAPSASNNSMQPGMRSWGQPEQPVGTAVLCVGTSLVLLQ